MKQRSNRDEAGTWRIRCSKDTHLTVTFSGSPKESTFPEKLVNVMGVRLLIHTICYLHV